MELKSQKNDHVVILTSDAEDASVKKFRFKPWMVWTAVILVCVIIGALLGYIAYEERIWEAANQKIEEYKAELDESKAENDALRMEIEGLNSKITVLSDTITQMKAIEADLIAKLERIATPTMLPITGSATIKEVTEVDPMSIFTAAEGAVVVATASGIVLETGEDTEFGHKIVIDHGNGYTSIYRYQSDPLVAIGDSVSQGGALYVIDEEDTELGYQITKDGTFVAPADMMEIKG
jgi:septal ring factor EnvC (AmiA/AmiB activator)